MADFVLKNNFDSKFYKQISGTAIGTKFAPPYACIFVDRKEDARHKTLVLEKIYWPYYCVYMDRKWRELRRIPWGPQ